MDPTTPRPNPAPGLPRFAVLLLALSFAGYGVFLARYTASFAAGSDSSGYFNSARLLSEGRFHASVRVPAGQHHTAFGLMTFQPLGFIIDENAARMMPTYPTGLPLHLLAASWFAGWRHAATIVNIFAALGSGLVLWGLARHVQLSASWAAAGLVLFWFCPLTLYASLQPMSDLVATLWCLAALYAALRSREHWCWSLQAGVGVSLAVLVRPTNVLLMLPLALALGWNFRRYLPFVLGGLPGGVFFCFYNWKAYGSPLVTGYGDVSTAFSTGFVLPSLAHFAWWIPALLSPLVCAALAAPFISSVRCREFAVLGLWAGLLTGFYAFYVFSGETWWYLRFILPAFPVFLLAALVVLQQVWRRLTIPLAANLVLAAVVAFGVVWQTRLTRRLDVLNIPVGEAHYLDAANWARDHLPPESALFCMQVSGAFFFYTPFLIIRWDQALASRMTELFALLQEQKRPVYAVLYDFEKTDAFARLGGRWKPIATVGRATVWQLETGPAAP